MTTSKLVKRLSRPLRLLIVQPYLPRYRLPFFDQLVARLAADGIDCRVAIPAAPLVQRDREDSSDAPWTIHTKARSATFAGRSFSMYGSAPARRGADAVITGLASTSLDTWAALYGAGRRIPVGLWGHVRNYVSPPSALDQHLKQIQARRADHIFAYTPQGALEAERWGVPAHRVTCVMNTVDTTALRQAQRQLPAEEVATFKDKHGLQPGKTSAFIGAIDTSKRIDFIVRVLDHIWQSDPEFKMLLGGSGDCHQLLAPAIARGQVVDMGFVTPADKALIGACASTICMPGRIGLVAIDSLVLRLPIITTNWPFHAPEVEYLENGTTFHTSSPDVSSFTSLLLDRTRARDAPYEVIGLPTIDEMVDRFQSGINSLLT